VYRRTVQSDWVVQKIDLIILVLPTCYGIRNVNSLVRSSVSRGRRDGEVEKVALTERLVGLMRFESTLFVFLGRF
jgi:hypothetical protein